MGLGGVMMDSYHHTWHDSTLSTAHNNIAKLFEKTFSHVKTDQSFWVWDKSILILLTDYTIMNSSITH
jgi:hypothetical protein